MEAALAKDLASLGRRCDFCESSLDQIRKSLLIYLKKKAESKHTHHMSTMLRNVGATETNPKLQDSFFKCSEAYAELDQLLLNYSECEAQQKLLLGEAKKLLVTPLRETITDCNNTLKKKGTKKTKTNIFDLRPAVNIDDDNDTNQRVLHQTNIIPHHSTMFEKHRLIYMKGILKSVLHAELQYHCQAIETLSPLFETLSAVDENELDIESSIRSFQASTYSLE